MEEKKCYSYGDITKKDGKYYILGDADPGLGIGKVAWFEISKEEALKMLDKQSNKLNEHIKNFCEEKIKELQGLYRFCQLNWNEQSVDVFDDIIVLIEKHKEILKKIKEHKNNDYI